MSCFKCCEYIDSYFMPMADFLHSPSSFPLTKRATTSYFGIFLSFSMIVSFIILSYLEIIKDDYIVSYSQEFIKTSLWNGKKITLGFNVTKNMTNETNFELEDSNGKIIELKKCNEQLLESENGTYNCIVDYPLIINYDSSHALKLKLLLKKNTTEYNNAFQFSLAIREPIIDHDNKDKPLDTDSNTRIDRFTCSFNPVEVSSYRRYLKLITYKSKKLSRFKIWKKIDKTFNGIYLDEFEDSRKTPSSPKDSNLLGTYRIMVSKKKDIYSREYKYVDILSLLSKLGGYIGSLKTVFTILCKIFVNPNDNYRIFDYLKKKRSIHLDIDSKSIYDDSSVSKNVQLQDFNRIVMDNRWFAKVWYKLSYFFCRCCSCKSKKIQSLFIIDKYIRENLTIENYLESQILSKKILRNINKIDELKAKHLNIFKKRKKDINNNNEISKDINYKQQPLLSYENIEMTSRNESNLRKQSTVFIENENEIIYFNEKQREDIIKIVLMEIF